MKTYFKPQLLMLLTVLFITSCDTSEDVADLQIQDPDAISFGQTKVALSGVDLSLRATSSLAGDLVIKVREENAWFPVYTITVPASTVAGNGVDYVTHKFSFTGSAPTLEQGKTYELSVSRSITSSPGDSIFWESSEIGNDPIANHESDHGDEDYVFGLYNFFSLSSEQPYGGDGHVISTDSRWQKFPYLFTARNPDNRIDMYLDDRFDNATGSFTIEVWDMAGNVLGSESILVSDIPVNIPGTDYPITSIYFSSSLGLEVGEKYRIAMKCSDQPTTSRRIDWLSNHPLDNPNTYPHGDSFGSPQPTLIDFSFRTYHNGLVDQVNLVDGYGVSLNNLYWRTQEFVVGAP